MYWLILAYSSRTSQSSITRSNSRRCVFCLSPELKCHLLIYIIVSFLLPFVLEIIKCFTIDLSLCDFLHYLFINFFSHFDVEITAKIGNGEWFSGVDECCKWLANEFLLWTRYNGFEEFPGNELEIYECCFNCFLWLLVGNFWDMIPFVLGFWFLALLLYQLVLSFIFFGYFSAF